MRRILLSCAILGVVMLPAAASARATGHGKPGYLVVRGAADDGGVKGRPAIQVVMHGFVLGSVKQRHEAQVDIFHLPSANSESAPSATGPDVTTTAVHWHGFTGKRFCCSDFRFRATGGLYRVVVRGSGIYLFAGGHGNVKLRGSSVFPRHDGKYSIDGGEPRSLPKQLLKREIGSR
jgi:hypothetical protein